jgi:hypothetical protein
MCAGSLVLLRLTDLVQALSSTFAIFEVADEQKNIGAKNGLLPISTEKYTQ